MKKEISFKGYKFIIPENDRNFEKELMAVIAILEKEVITETDKWTLIQSVPNSIHKTGKIAGAGSIDCSASNCEFCRKMRKAAETDATIICSLCYDYAQEQYKINALNRHSLTMLILESVRFSREQLQTVQFSFIERICSSGDTPNVVFAENVIDMIDLHPYAHVAWWAKNTAAVITAVDKLGKPSNLKLVQSAIRIDKSEPLKKYFNYLFLVSATKEKVKEYTANGCCECNGKKCQECGWKCYFGSWPDGSVIVEYLRCSKEKRQEIIAAIEKRDSVS